MGVILRGTSFILTDNIDISKTYGTVNIAELKSFRVLKSNNLPKLNNKSVKMSWSHFGFNFYVNIFPIRFYYCGVAAYSNFKSNCK